MKGIKLSVKFHHIITALGILLIVVGLILQLNSHKKEDENTEKKPKELVVDISELTDKKEINKIIDQFNKLRIPESDLFMGPTYYVENMDVNQLLLTAFEDFNITATCGGSDNKMELSIDMINEKLNKFVSRVLTLDEINTMIETSSLNLVQGSYCYNASLVDEKLNVTNCNCGIINQEKDFVNSKVVNAEENSEYVFIYKKIAFGRYQGDMTLDDKVDYYRSFDRNEEVVETLSSPLIDEMGDNQIPEFEPHWELYNTYKYTFRKVEDNYYFASLEMM